MALDEVKSAREKYQRYSGLVGALKDDVSQREAVAQTLVDLATDAAMDRNGPEFANILAAASAQDYNMVLGDAMNYAKGAKGEFVTKVGANYDEVLKKVADKDLFEVAYFLPRVSHADADLTARAEIAEKSKKIVGEAENKSYGTYMKDLKDRSSYGFKVLSRMAIINPEYIATPAIARSMELQKKFSDGLSRNKAETYVSDVVNSGDAKKQKAAYELVGDKASL